MRVGISGSQNNDHTAATRLRLAYLSITAAAHLLCCARSFPIIAMPVESKYSLVIDNVSNATRTNDLWVSRA